MNTSDVLKIVDHTLLAQTATWAQIREILDDAMKYHTASACIPAAYVKQAAEYVQGRLPICTVIGFPNGYSTTETKVFEAKNAIENGASEIDMVINIGFLKDGRYEEVEKEIRKIHEAGHRSCFLLRFCRCSIIWNYYLENQKIMQSMPDLPLIRQERKCCWGWM